MKHIQHMHKVKQNSQGHDTIIKWMQIMSVVVSWNMFTFTVLHEVWNHRKDRLTSKLRVNFYTTFIPRTSLTRKSNLHTWLHKVTELNSMPACVEVRRIYRDVCFAGNQSTCEEHETFGICNSGHKSDPNQWRAQKGKEEKYYNLQCFRVVLLMLLLLLLLFKPKS